MTRFAWLQARSQTVVAALLLALIAIVAALTGPQLAHLYSADIVPCAAHGDCQQQIDEFLRHDHFLRNSLDLLLRVAPALIGVFWGAPLVAREMETGTFRLAWTQSVSRTRWLLTKLVLVGLISAAVGGLLSLAITWWYRSTDLVTADRFAAFDRRGVVAIGYAVFAFALGALLGAVVRRTLAAMALTLAGFVGARVAVAEWVRPHLFAPLHAAVPLSSANGLGFMLQGSTVRLVANAPSRPNAWVQSTEIVTMSGQPTTAADRSAFVHTFCPAIAHPPAATAAPGVHVHAADAGAFQHCQDQANHVFRLLVSYQPADRWWALQWVETGIFVALALLAAVGCVWWVKRRTA